MLVNLENLEKPNVWSSQDSPFVCPFKVLPSHLRSGFSKIILQVGLKLLFLLSDTLMLASSSQDFFIRVWKIVPTNKTVPEINEKIITIGRHIMGLYNF